ncbi:hypothetical protein DM02DRAFT_630516 [Periconia macrospinosa]|uniref:Uncharacterized protein n=1 Tax=Periconia macrospinosa TaxID=97972 RepID=A0A2V1DJ50_9PLEO|nr:hypothetical protein DM02DRAFT_630516 [Periconia macrospinosa]
MKNVEAQVKDLLCGDEKGKPWIWGMNQMLHFYRDGTGSIEAGVDLHSEASLEFSWIFTAAPVKDKNSWKLAMMITLGTRFHSGYQNENNPWIQGAELQKVIQKSPSPTEAPFPWAPLLSTAFRPKQYNVTLSCGRFIEPFQLATKEPYPLFKRYRDAPRRSRLQLVFDVSPYPPREEWIREKHYVMDHLRFWDMKVFVTDYIERKDETWAETLDWNYWLSPTAGGWR